MLSLPLLCSDAKGSLVTYHLDLETAGAFYQFADSVSISEIPFGEVFHIDFTIDNAVLDANSLTQGGSFEAALTSFRVLRSAENAGSWDPSGGAWTLPAAVSTTSNLAVQKNFFHLGAPATGMPPIAWTGSSPDQSGSEPLGFLGITLRGFLISDSGSGQSLSEQLGDWLSHPPEYAGYWSTQSGLVSLNLEGSNYGSGPHPLIPEPLTPGLLAAALAILAGRRNRAHENK